MHICIVCFTDGLHEGLDGMAIQFSNNAEKILNNEKDSSRKKRQRHDFVVAAPVNFLRCYRRAGDRFFAGELLGESTTLAKCFRYTRHRVPAFLLIVKSRE